MGPSEKILAAARVVIEEKGVDSFSLRAVAAKAGVSLGTVTYYYPNRSALVEACLESLHTLHREAIELVSRGLSEGRSFAEMASALVDSLFPRLLDEREWIRVRMLGILKDDGLPERQRNRVLAPAVELGAAQLEATTKLNTAEARMMVNALIFVVSRFAILSPVELLLLTQEEDLDAAETKTRAFLVSLAERLLRDEAPAA